MLTAHIKGYVGQEIPVDVPFTEYYSYIRKNIPCQALSKPKSEWTESDWKEYNSEYKRLMIASLIKGFADLETINDKQKLIIELCRNGTDFDDSDNTPGKLLKQPFLPTTKRLMLYLSVCEQE